MRRAVSVVELVLAFLVLALAVVPLVGLFGSAGQQNRQTSEHGLAMTLSSRFGEELRLAAWENVHQPRHVMGEPAYASRARVVESNSKLLEVIEDTHAPYGELREREDQGVTRAFADLHRQLSAFRARLGSVERPAPVSGTLLDLDVELSWVDAKEREIKRNLAIVVPAHPPFHAPPEGFGDPRAVDERIRELFFPAATGTLEAAVAAGGGDLRATRNAGTVVLLMQSLQASDAPWGADVAQAAADRAAATTPAAKARAQLRVARLLESRAAQVLLVMDHLAAPLTELAATFTRAQLGAATLPQPAFADAAAALPAAPEYFADLLARAHGEYATAYNPPLGPALARRPRTRVLMKVLEIGKLRALTAGPEDLSQLRAILTDFARLEDGANVNFRAFARTELEDCRDVATLRQRYPPWRARAFETYRQQAAPASTRLAAAVI